MTSSKVALAVALAFLVSVPSAHADDPPPPASSPLPPPASSPPEGALVVTVEGTPTRPKTGSRDPTAASFVLRRDRLRDAGDSTADVLAEVPGVQLARTGSGSDLATASIRGATSAETPVYLAGIRINDDLTGTADLSTVPLWMIDRIEVYRGNAPEEADRLGIGGAIFLDPVLPRGGRVGLGLGGGSFRDVSSWQAGAVGDERAGAMVALRQQSAANDFLYLDDHGTRFNPASFTEQRRQNADDAAYDVWSIGRFQVGRGSITAVANAFTRDQGVPGLPIAPAYFARSHVQRMLGGATAKLPCAREDGRCEVEIGSSAILTGQGISDPFRELGLDSTWVNSTGQRVAEDARLRYRFGDAVRVSVSATAEMEHLSIDRSDPGPAETCTTSGPLRAGRATSRETAAVAVDPINLFRRSAAAPSPLEVSVLGAVEYHGTDGPVRSDACSAHVLAPEGRLGARLRIFNGLDLLANAGRYVRVPTLGELYGVSPLVLGNAELAPEEGVTADGGARLTSPRTRAGHASAYAEVFGFGRFADDLIAYRESSLGVIKPYNAGRARVLGVEVAAGAAAFDFLRADLALTALDPRDVSVVDRPPSSLLPFQARLVAAPSIELFQEGPFGGVVDRVALGGRYVYRASRTADPAGLVVLPAENTVDVQLTVLLAKRSVTARLKVQNVLDARNFDVIGLPLPSRGVYGSLEAWWW
jgi:vitamin B12 transporter